MKGREHEQGGMRTQKQREDRKKDKSGCEDTCSGARNGDVKPDGNGSLSDYERAE